MNEQSVRQEGRGAARGWPGSEAEVRGAASPRPCRCNDPNARDREARRSRRYEGKACRTRKAEGAGAVWQWRARRRLARAVQCDPLQSLRRADEHPGAFVGRRQRQHKQDGEDLETKTEGGDRGDHLPALAAGGRAQSRCRRSGKPGADEQPGVSGPHLRCLSTVSPRLLARCCDQRCFLYCHGTEDERLFVLAPLTDG